LILEGACVSPVPPLPQHDAVVESLPVVLCCGVKEKHVLKKSNSCSAVSLNIVDQYGSFIIAHDFYVWICLACFAP